MTRQTSEKDRLRIRTLFFDGKFTKREIERITGFTTHQIRAAIQHEKARPRTGRPPAMSSEEEAQLIEFVCSTAKTRRMSFLQLSITLFDGKYGEYAIRSTLRRHGYKRYAASEKPGLPEKSHDTKVPTSTP